MKKNNLFIKICKICSKVTFVIMMASFALQILVSNETAIKGKELAGLLERKDVLEKEVSFLEIEASSLSSLLAIEVRAKLLGFVEVGNSFDIVRPASVAAISSF